MTAWPKHYAVVRLGAAVRFVEVDLDAERLASEVVEDAFHRQWRVIAVSKCAAKPSGTFVEMPGVPLATVGAALIARNWRLRISRLESMEAIRGCTWREVFGVLSWVATDYQRYTGILGLPVMLEHASEDEVKGAASKE